LANRGSLFGSGGTPRDLVIASALGLVVVLGAFLAGWREAAAFGLVVILILDLLVVLRGRAGGVRSGVPAKEEPDVTQDWPDIPYERALAAFDAGEKLYLGAHTFLVCQALRDNAQGLVLWVTDERTLGDHGLLLYPDGRVKVK
jgi:hypothetical protein